MNDYPNISMSKMKNCKYTCTCIYMCAYTCIYTTEAHSLSEAIFSHNAGFGTQCVVDQLPECIEGEKTTVCSHLLWSNEYCSLWTSTVHVHVYCSSTHLW